MPLRNATYGLDFHDDVRPNCGENCSRAAWEASKAPACYDPGQDSQKCSPNQQRSPALNEAVMCYTCDDTDHYSTHLIAKRAQAVIMNHADDPATPLFLYLPFQDTHGPAEVPSYYRDAYTVEEIPDPVRRELAGKLSAVDEALKNVTGALETKGMLSNTIIFYTADK